MTSHSRRLSEAVATEVRAEMGRQRKTQVDLARLLKVHQATAARRLDGSKSLDVIELATVAAWLGTTASNLLSCAERSSSSPARISA